MAVTVRPDIDTIRNIEAISVVNLEVFFHAPIDDNATGKIFDARAFVRRIEQLNRARPTKDDRSEKTRNEVVRQDLTGRHAFGWWESTRKFLSGRVLVKADG